MYNLNSLLCPSQGPDVQRVGPRHIEEPQHGDTGRRWEQEDCGPFSVPKDSEAAPGHSKLSEQHCDLGHKACRGSYHCGLSSIL